MIGILTLTTFAPLVGVAAIASRGEFARLLALAFKTASSKN